MSISNPIKWLVGAATVWLLSYPAFFLILWLLSFQSMVTGSSELPFINGIFSYLFPVHCLTAILQLVLLGFYLVHILRSQLASEPAKIGFALSIVILPYLGMPAYYYLFIWRDHPPQWALSPKAKSETQPPRLAMIPGPASPFRKWIPLAVIVAIAIVVVGALAVTVASVAPILVGAMRDGFYEPEPPTYELVHRLPDLESLTYKPAPSEDFQPISSFSQIRTWRYSKQAPIAIQGDTLVVAGYFSSATTSRTTVDILGIDLHTGHVQWQAIAGDNYIASDSDRVYYTSGRDSFAAISLIASDIHTGDQLWETALPYENAIGIEYLALVDDTLAARTYHRGNGAFYSIEPQTGLILNSVTGSDSIVAMSRGQTIEWYGDTLALRGQGGWTTHLDTERSVYDYQLGAPSILETELIVQNGFYSSAPITALSRSDGLVLWRYEGRSASNLAVDGSSLFFVDDRGTLVVLDLATGEATTSLQFIPQLTSDFDFANNSLLVAAQGGRVAVYFEDAEQLTVLQYTP
jgi:hypothetical protein